LSFCVVHPLSNGECGRVFGSMMGKALQGSLDMSWEIFLAILHHKVDAWCGARSPFICLIICFIFPHLGNLSIGHWIKERVSSAL
jgi:hypothetical protein